MNKEMIVVTNRQAFRDFHIERTFEAGLQLKGNEVKSLRGGQANLKGSFAKFEGEELYCDCELCKTNNFLAKKYALFC